jgi:hypothetical protein
MKIKMNYERGDVWRRYNFPMFDELPPTFAQCRNKYQGLSDLTVLIGHVFMRTNALLLAVALIVSV